MPQVKARHNPELTAEQAMQIFRIHFSGRYKIHWSGVSRSAFLIRRSAWTGVRTRLIHKKSEIYFQLSEDVPSTGLRVLGFLMVLIPALWPVLLVLYIWAKRSTKPLLNEVSQFITTEPEFN
jgi:hypothetical protein